MGKIQAEKDSSGRIGVKEEWKWGPVKEEEVHDYILRNLQTGGQYFLKEFTSLTEKYKKSTVQSDGLVLSPEEEDILGGACEPRSQEDGETILHRIIDAVSRNTLDPEVAASFIKLIVPANPDLVWSRDRNELNALEVAAGSQNCLELIRIICEHGMLQMITDQQIYPPTEQLPTGSGQELNHARIPVNLPSDLEYNDDLNKPDTMAPVSEQFSTTNTEKSGGKTQVIKKGGQEWFVQVHWEKMVKDGKDTCLHIAITKSRNETATYLLERMQDMNEHQLVLLHENQSGLTPLHLAVHHALCKGNQVKLVELLITLCPNALRSQRGTITGGANSKGVQKYYAPYKYFLETLEKSTQRPNDTNNVTVIPPSRFPRRKVAGPTVRVPEEVADPGVVEQMRTLLRLACMRYHGRNRETIKNLIGKRDEIHLNLASREEVTLQFFTYMARLYNFEPILQYVYIPNLRVIDVHPHNIECDHAKLVKEPWWKGSSRKDCFYIFRWLRSKNVERILSVTVEDDLVNPHSDEVIEKSVESFQIETWDWMKLDMCSDTIYAAARNVRNLTLYWSGRRAVLKSWAAVDGLAKLEKLSILARRPADHEQTSESPSRFVDLKRKFEDRFKLSWNEMNNKAPAPTLTFPDLATRNQPSKKLSEKQKEEKTLQQRWITCMDDFVQKLMSYLNNRKELNEQEEVKVAIIDDGVYPDRDGVGDLIAKDGSDFFNDRDDQDQSQWSAPYQSTYGHGHLMACLIKRLCPKVKLYIAKLDEVWSEGKSQITTESASKAIEWANSKKVDIISMSWTIETPAEAWKERLKSAVKEALNQEILLFCASDDQGNLTNMPYPACIDERIFWIGPATALGKATESAQQGAMFLAPGQEVDISQEDPHARKPRVGSSIATARSAGLAALILQCMFLVPDGYQRSQVRKEVWVRKMFERLSKSTNSTARHKYLRVWNVFDIPSNSMDMDDKELKAIERVVYLFHKDVEDQKQPEGRQSNGILQKYVGTTL